MASPNAQAPLPDDFSRESIELVLQRLEGWKPEHRQEPTEDEMTFAKKQIEWLEKAMYELRGSDQLWIRTLSRLAATCRRSIQAPDSLSPLKEELTLAEKAHAFGGTAEVYKGIYHERTVAVKSFRGKTITEIRRDFIDEVIIWKWSQHDHIVPFIGIYETEGLGPCLVSEWMENGTIMAYLKLRPLEPRTKYMKDILTGLNYIHVLRLVHADIKENNVLVDSQGRARLTDFGISVTSSATHTNNGSERGSWNYKAPEITNATRLRGEPTQESDYFGLGHLLWEMFSLTNPYLTIGQEYLVGKHIASGKRPPRPNADASIGFSDAIWTAIEQCWTQEWEPRRKGWEALVEILDVDTSESGVDAAYAKNLVEQMKEEDPSPERSPSPTVQVHSKKRRWEDWPHTYNQTRCFVQRPLLPTPVQDVVLHDLLLPGSGNLIFDFSLYVKRFLRVKSDATNVLDNDGDEQAQLEDMPAEGLAHLASPITQTDIPIRYVEVTCALLPGWKVHINEHSLSEMQRRPPFFPPTPPRPPPPAFDDMDAIPKTSLFCIPLSWGRKSPGASKIKQQSSSPDKKDEEKPDELPAVPDLAPPVLDDEIELLRPITINDLFQGLYYRLQEPIPGREMSRWPFDKQMVTQQCFGRRSRRHHTRDVATKEELETWGVLRVDLLLEDIMFDGFIPTKLDGRGGVELELLTRSPTEPELSWFDDVENRIRISRN